MVVKENNSAPSGSISARLRQAGAALRLSADKVTFVRKEIPDEIERAETECCLVGRRFFTIFCGELAVRERIDDEVVAFVSDSLDYALSVLTTNGPYYSSLDKKKKELRDIDKLYTFLTDDAWISDENAELED